MLKVLKNDMQEGGSLNIAKSMAELYSGGEAGNKTGVSALNRKEKKAIVGVLKSMGGKDSQNVKDGLNAVLTASGGDPPKAASRA